MLVEDIVCEKGYFYVPDKPGLGVTVNEEILDEWA